MSKHSTTSFKAGEALACSYFATAQISSRAPPVVRLTNGVAYHGTNSAQPSYFYFDVPLEANVAINQLESLGLPLRLLYNADGLPDAQRQPGDVLLLPFVTGPQATAITTTQPIATYTSVEHRAAAPVSGSAR